MTTGLITRLRAPADVVFETTARLLRGGAPWDQSKPVGDDRDAEKTKTLLFQDFSNEIKGWAVV